MNKSKDLFVSFLTVAIWCCMIVALTMAPAMCTPDPVRANKNGRMNENNIGMGGILEGDHAPLHTEAAS